MFKRMVETAFWSAVVVSFILMVVALISGWFPWM